MACYQVFAFEHIFYLQKIKMEVVPGVLFYKISEYADLESIPIMELFSTGIQNKLHGNLSGF